MRIIQKHQQGFSLVEVLVALVIVAISLGAFLQTTQTSVAHTFILKNTLLSQNFAWNKIIADYLAEDDYYQLKQKQIDTPVATIKKITVTASYKNKVLSTLTKFLYVEEKK